MKGRPKLENPKLQSSLAWDQGDRERAEAIRASFGEDMEMAVIARRIIRKGLNAYDVDGKLFEGDEPMLRPLPPGDIAVARESYETIRRLEKEFGESNVQTEEGFEIPEVGHISAGPRGLSPHAAHVTLHGGYYWHSRGAKFVLRVQGDGFSEMGIINGDLLFVRPTSKVRNGETVIGILNGNVVIRRHEVARGLVRLTARHPFRPTIELTRDDDFLVCGVVIGRSGTI